LGEFARNPVLSSIKHFPEDYQALVQPSAEIPLAVAAD
jgi:hypothetical protein